MHALKTDEIPQAFPSPKRTKSQRKAERFTWRERFAERVKTLHGIALLRDVFDAEKTNPEAKTPTAKVKKPPKKLREFRGDAQGFKGIFFLRAHTRSEARAQLKNRLNKAFPEFVPYTRLPVGVQLAETWESRNGLL